MFRPFRATWFGELIPRTLSWAVLSGPFGARTESELKAKRRERPFQGRRALRSPIPRPLAWADGTSLAGSETRIFGPEEAIPSAQGDAGDALGNLGGQPQDDETKTNLAPRRGRDKPAQGIALGSEIANLWKP